MKEALRIAFHSNGKQATPESITDLTISCVQRVHPSRLLFIAGPANIREIKDPSISDQIENIAYKMSHQTEGLRTICLPYFSGYLNFFNTFRHIQPTDFLISLMRSITSQGRGLALIEDYLTDEQQKVSSEAQKLGFRGPFKFKLKDLAEPGKIPTNFWRIH